MTFTVTTAGTNSGTSTAATRAARGADGRHRAPGRHRARPLADRSWRVTAVTRRTIAVLLCGAVAARR